MADHDHDQAVAMFGDCPVCSVADGLTAPRPPMRTQPDVPAPAFDGATFRQAIDAHRLGRQLRDVALVMCDGQWHTLGQLADRTGHPEASVSARLRDLRKARFGGYVVEHRRQGLPGLGDSGTWEYRVALHHPGML